MEEHPAASNQTPINEPQPSSPTTSTPNQIMSTCTNATADANNQLHTAGGSAVASVTLAFGAYMN